MKPADNDAPRAGNLAPLDGVSFRDAVSELARRYEDLAGVVQRYGAPRLWVREPGFPSLMYIILEQQVSLASAKAAFDRLNAAVRLFWHHYLSERGRS